MYKDVIGYEGSYEVSDEGVIRSKKTGNIKCQSINHKGYSVVCLYQDGIAHTKSVHKIVYEAFHCIVPAGYDIHHKDHNKQNNNLKNLVVMSHEQHNRLHGKEGINRLTKNSIPCYVFDKDSLKRVGYYDNCSIAGRALGRSSGNITKAIKNDGLCAGYYISDKPVIEKEKILIYKDNKVVAMAANVPEVAEKIGASRQSVYCSMADYRPCKGYCFEKRLVNERIISRICEKFNFSV